METSLPLSPASISWRVTTEPSVIAFGGPRALLLQVLHPLVAAGVEDHSDYRAHPWTRLYRTLDTVLKLAFGDPGASAQRADMLRRRHVRVTGVSSDGEPYEALDPRLLLWVWATLVDTAVLVYGATVSSLSTVEREEYYEEQKLVAYACGVPEGACPARWADFEEYMQRTIETELRVTATTRAVAASIVKPPLPRPLASVGGWAIAAMTGALLPERFVAELGLPAGGSTRVVKGAFAMSRGVARVAPGRLRRLPLAPFIGTGRKRPAPAHS
ncbi:MAG: oxygenase MpaB family protein [Acidimicrobiales bacterium]